MSFNRLTYDQNNVLTQREYQPRTELVERRAAAATVVSTLPIFVYVELRKPSLETFGYICVAPHISVLSYLFIDP